MRWYELFESPLTELFDNGVANYRWRYQDDSTWSGEFKIDNSLYTVEAWPRNEQEWEFEFSDRSQISQRDQWNNTGLRREKSFVIFSTVLAMLEDFLEGQSPDALVFSGSKKNNRSDLYLAMIKNQAKKIEKLGYSTDVSDSGKDLLFKFNKISN